MALPSNQSIISFIRRLWVWSKPEGSPVGDYVQLKTLHEEQLTIINALLAGLSIIILKARQIGSTTCIAAVFFSIWFLTDKPEKMAIYSYTHEAAERAYSKCRLMYEKLPKSLKKLRPAKITSTQMIMLDTQAVISKHSMEQKGAGLRGDSYSRVYLTEYAMAKDPEKLKASALSAIGTTGQVIFEGTADHIGDGLYHEYLNAESTGYTTYFFPWTEHKDYTLPTTGEEVWDDEEKSLLQEGLSYQQLMFRRHWITRLGESKFLAEYPRTFDEAYQQTPGSYINKKYTDIIVVYKTRPDKVFYHEQPRAHHTYVIGLDTAMGAGKDYSSLHVLNARTLELVASFRSNSLYPTLFVDRAAEIASYYNKATINYERNGESGGIVGERLRSLKCNIMLYEDGQAWNTTSKSKRQLLETLRMSLIEQSISKLDDFTLQDLEDAQMDSTGKLIIDRSKQGSHFDGGMSLAFAVHAARNITLKPLPDWSRMYEVKSSTRKDLGRI